jgi:hypothetical protein
MHYSIPLGAALLLASATLASAQNMFGIISRMDQGSYIDLNIPNVTEDGYVVAYPVRGQTDEIIGFQEVRAGPATNQRMRLDGNVTDDVRVYLFHGEPFQPLESAIDSVVVDIDNRD